MKINLKMNVKAVIAVLALVVFAGCSMYDDSCVWEEIDKLKGRVSTLEDATAALQARLDAGVLIKSVTPIEEAPGGWRIEFTGGSPSTIDILNGETSSNPDPVDGITPQLAVRTVDGKTTLWVDYGDGWTDTGEDLKGPQGATGSPGADGITPKLKVEKNSETGKVTVWYNVTYTETSEGTWIDTGYDLSVTGPVRSIVGNGDGTVTITMNGTEPVNTFTFRETTVATHVEVRTTGVVEITEGSTAEVVFVVNPSDATINTGDMSLWELDRIATRAGYVNADDVFSIRSITGSGGKYTATVAAAADSYDTADNDEHTVAIVYNAGSAAEPSLISSGMFELKVKPILNRRITWDGSGYSLTTDPTDAGLYFKFGGVVGVYSGNGANQTLPVITADPFDSGDVAWSPTTVTTWASIPMYADSPAPVDAAYHTAANVKAGKGDPCRLVGLDLDRIKTTDAGSLTSTDIDNGEWRLPTVEENHCFSGYGDAMINTNEHWTTLSGSGVVGGMFPDTSGGSADTFLPAAGYRNYLDGEVREQGKYGYYYTSDKCILVFLSGLVVHDVVTYYAIGHSVRCVRQ